METIVPYILSIVIQLAFASLGKLNSGEPFDIIKFSETLAVQITALVAFIIAAYFTTIDLSLLIVALPTLISTFIMKLYSYIKKKRAGTV